MNEIINKLYETQDASDDELKVLIDLEDVTELREAAIKRRKQWYGTDVFMRGLIEFTNYCKNNCYYCGIRAGNHQVERYRLTKAQILECCEIGYKLGFRTFVMQGGEDPYFTDEMVCEIVREIKGRYSDAAVTLSIGEKSRASYQAYFDAGADRYLLRHETALCDHYAKLHPGTMSLENRKKCLFALKEIGYQVGAGYMVGSPHQTLDNLVADLRFLQELRPAMIGIGPFLPHSQTPFANEAKGSLSRTLNLLSIMRLMFPGALLPATTSLGTIDPRGREMGLEAGANVVMPNLSPVDVRRLYTLYDNKICMGEEAAVCNRCLKRRVQSVGYHLVVDRGDVRRKPLDCEE